MAAQLPDRLSDRLSDDQRQALQILGFLYLRLGQNERARRLYTALMRLDPGDTEVRLRLALALIRLKDGRAALDTLSGIVFSRPGTRLEEVCHLLHARAHALLGETKEAGEYALTFWRMHTGNRP